MSKQAWTIAKINLKNIKSAYFTVGIVALTMLVQFIIQMVIAAVSGKVFDQSGLSVGCVLWLLPLMAAIIIPTKNFRRIVNLGGKRDHFIWGSLMVYAALALIISAVNTLIYYTFDSFIQSSGYFGADHMGGVMNAIEVFGWTANGGIAAFAQQFAFLLLVSAAVHTLVAMQDKWYGWVTDVLLAAIISVFTPIAPLRAVLIGFFNLIIFQSNVFLQIAICLVLAIVIYSANKPIYARKAI